MTEDNNALDCRVGRFDDHVVVGPELVPQALLDFTMDQASGPAHDSGLIDDARSALDRLGGDVEAEVLFDRAGDEATHRVRLIELDPRY